MLNALTVTPKYQWQHKKNVIFDGLQVPWGHPWHQRLPNTPPIVYLPFFSQNSITGVAKCRGDWNMYFCHVLVENAIGIISIQYPLCHGPVFFLDSCEFMFVVPEVYEVWGLL